MFFTSLDHNSSLGMVSAAYKIIMMDDKLLSFNQTPQILGTASKSSRQLEQHTSVSCDVSCMSTFMVIIITYPNIRNNVSVSDIIFH